MLLLGLHSSSYLVINVLKYSLLHTKIYRYVELRKYVTVLLFPCDQVTRSNSSLKNMRVHNYGNEVASDSFVFLDKMTTAEITVDMDISS